MGTSRGLVVEFVGLPAAGKTRLAAEVKQELLESTAGRVGWADTEVTTSSEKRGEDLGLLKLSEMAMTRLLLSPSLCWGAANGIRRTNQPSATYDARFFGYLIYVVEELRRARANQEIHLADQGYLQHLWRILLSSGVDGWEPLMKLAKLHYPIYEPEIVVFVSVEHRTRMERGRRRGTDVDDELFDPSHPAIKEDIESYEQMREFVPSLADELGVDPRILDIDNSSELLEENVARIRDCILEEFGKNYPHLDMTVSPASGRIYREKSWWG